MNQVWCVSSVSELGLGSTGTDMSQPCVASATNEYETKHRQHSIVISAMDSDESQSDSTDTRATLVIPHS